MCVCVSFSDLIFLKSICVLKFNEIAHAFHISYGSLETPTNLKGKGCLSVNFFASPLKKLVIWKVCLQGDRGLIHMTTIKKQFTNNSPPAAKKDPYLRRNRMLFSYRRTAVASEKNPYFRRKLLTMLVQTPLNKKCHHSILKLKLQIMKQNILFSSSELTGEQRSLGGVLFFCFFFVWKNVSKVDEPGNLPLGSHVDSRQVLLVHFQTLSTGEAY